MTDISKLVNRAVIYSDPPGLRTEVIELPIQEPGVGEVLVRLLYSGVCHTGQIGGHEGIGKVLSHGPNVTTPPIGSHVGIKFSADACLHCTNCLQGGETTCATPSSRKISGYFTPGTFQQYVVSPAHYVTPIPEEIAKDEVLLAGAAPLMCGGVTVYTALKRAGVKFGDWVVVSGAGGGLGHLAIQYAKAFSARVLALDVGSKEAFCKSLGADEFVDFTKFEDDAKLEEKVKEATNGGAKIVLQCSSSNRAYRQAVGWLGFRGTLAVLGVPEPDEPIAGAKVGAMIGNELKIFAIKSGNRLDAKECLEIAARGLVKTHYQLRKMEDLTNIFTEMEAGKINGRVVLDLR